MSDLEMRLGKEIAEAVEKDNVVVFRSETTRQPYALFKLKDEPGAVAGFGNGIWTVTTADYKNAKPVDKRKRKE